MKTKDEMWTMFLDMHKDMSMQDLQDVKQLYETGYGMGELSGLERGREVMANHNNVVNNLLSDIFKI